MTSPRGPKALRPQRLEVAPEDVRLPEPVAIEKRRVGLGRGTGHDQHRSARAERRERRVAGLVRAGDVQLEHRGQIEDPEHARVPHDRQVLEASLAGDGGEAR